MKDIEGWLVEDRAMGIPFIPKKASKPSQILWAEEL